LNVEVVRAGALLHDVAKGRPDHANVGAALLRSMDFPRVATVVSAHTDLDFSSGQLDESAIVYLADKLVRGDNQVTLNQRFQTALARFSNDPHTLNAVQNRMATAQAVAHAVEARIGIPLASILGGAGKP
jgi:HD-like signal output (HDOD) protein